MLIKAVFINYLVCPVIKRTTEKEPITVHKMSSGVWHRALWWFWGLQSGTRDKKMLPLVLKMESVR